MKKKNIKNIIKLTFFVFGYFFISPSYLMTQEPDKEKLSLFDLIKNLSSNDFEEKKKGLTQIGHPAEYVDWNAGSNHLLKFFLFSPCCVKINGFHPWLMGISFTRPEGNLFLLDINGNVIQEVKHKGKDWDPVEEKLFERFFEIGYIKNIYLLSLLGDDNEQILIEEKNAGGTGSWEYYYYIFRVTSQGIVNIWEEKRLVHSPVDDFEAQIYFEDFPGEKAKRIVYKGERIEYEADFATDSTRQVTKINKIFRYNEVKSQYELLK